MNNLLRKNESIFYASLSSRTSRVFLWFLTYIYRVFSLTETFNNLHSSSCKLLPKIHLLLPGKITKSTYESFGPVHTHIYTYIIYSPTVHCIIRPKNSSCECIYLMIHLVICQRDICLKILPRFTRVTSRLSSFLRDSLDLVLWCVSSRQNLFLTIYYLLPQSGIPGKHIHTQDIRLYISI